MEGLASKAPGDCGHRRDHARALSRRVASARSAVCRPRRRRGHSGEHLGATPQVDSVGAGARGHDGQNGQRDRERGQVRLVGAGRSRDPRAQRAAPSVTDATVTARATPFTALAACPSPASTRSTPSAGQWHLQRERVGLPYHSQGRWEHQRRGLSDVPRPCEREDAREADRAAHDAATTGFAVADAAACEAAAARVAGGAGSRRGGGEWGWRGESGG